MTRPVADQPRSAVGEWVPVQATKQHDIFDVLLVEGYRCGHIESFGGSVYAYILGERLGSYRRVTDARLEVEQCAERALPLIRWLAARERGL